MITALLLLGCPDKKPSVDSSPPVVDGCVASDERSVELGVLGGNLFTPFDDGQEVRLESAPQGGSGVSISARTIGTAAGGPGEFVIDILLEPYIDGVIQGSFVSEGLTLYCKENEDDDGTYGLVTGAVVGFDPEVYVTDEDLAALDGESIDLLVGITDAEGGYAEGHADVVISFD